MNCLKSNIPECSKFYGPGMSLEHLKLQKLSQFWCSLLMKDQDNFLIYRPLQWPRAPGLLQAWKQSWDPAKFLSATSSECSSVNFLSLSPSPQLSPRFKFDFGKEKMRKSQISAQQSEQKKKTPQNHLPPPHLCYSLVGVISISTSVWLGSPLIK